MASDSVVSFRREVVVHFAESPSSRREPFVSLRALRFAVRVRFADVFVRFAERPSSVSLSPSLRRTRLFRREAFVSPSAIRFAVRVRFVFVSPNAIVAFVLSLFRRALLFRGAIVSMYVSFRRARAQRCFNF